MARNDGATTEGLVNPDGTLDTEAYRKAQAILQAKGDSAGLQLLKQLGQQSSKQYAGGRVVPIDVTGLNQAIAGIGSAYVGGQEQKEKEDAARTVAQTNADWLKSKPVSDDPQELENWLTQGDQLGLRSTLQEKIYGVKANAAKAKSAQEAAALRASSTGGTSGGSSKAPSGYRWTEDATALEPIPGGPAAAKAKAQTGAYASPKTTESERSSAGFLSRMKAAESSLDELEAKHGKGAYPDELFSVSGGVPAMFGLSGVGDYAQSKVGSTAQNLYKQQSEDWIRAKLRKESGAVIGDEEMTREYATYFPQAGDSPAVIAQKKRSRKEAEKQFQYSAGNADKPQASLRDDINAAIDQDLQPKAIRLAQAMLQQGAKPQEIQAKLTQLGVSNKALEPIMEILYPPAQATPAQAAPAQAAPAQAAPTPAPAAAIEALKANPGLADQFKAKYGYLP